MMDQDAGEDAGFRWDGSFLLPSRLIRWARSGAARADLPNPEAPSDRELSAFLEILGYLAVGSTIWFDGTVPDDFRETTIGAKPSLPELRAVSALDLEVRPLPGPNDGERGSLEVEVTKAAKLLAESGDDHLESPGSSGSRGRELKPERFEPFFEAARAMVAESDTQGRVAAARHAYEEGIMGGKLLLGLAGAEDDYLLGRLTEVPIELRAATLSATSTKFRSFLLAGWASENSSLYSALREQVHVLEGRRKNIWTEVERRLSEEMRPAESAIHTTMPVVGAAILLTAPETSSPPDLVRRAKELGRSWDLGRLQRDLLRMQLAGEQHGVSAVVEEIRGLIEEYQRRALDGKTNPVARPNRSVYTGLVGDALKAGIDAVANAPVSLFSHAFRLSPRPTEPILAFVAHCSIATSSLSQELRDRAAKMWGAL